MCQNGLALVESPRGCLSQSGGCFFGTIKKNDFYQYEQNKIYLGSETVLEKSQNQNKFIFHQGQVIIEVDANLEMLVQNSKIAFSRGEYVLIHKGNYEYILRTLEGRAEVKTKNQKMEVTEGFEVVIFGKEAQDDQLSSIRIIAKEEHLLEYAKLKQLNPKQIKKYIASFIIKYKNYQNWYAELNGKLYDRHIAEENEKAKREEKHHKMNRLASERIRKLYYNKVFER